MLILIVVAHRLAECTRVRFRFRYTSTLPVSNSMAACLRIRNINRTRRVSRRAAVWACDCVSSHGSSWLRSKLARPCEFEVLDGRLELIKRGLRKMNYEYELVDEQNWWRRERKEHAKRARRATSERRREERTKKAESDHKGRERCERADGRTSDEQEAKRKENIPSKNR